MLLFIGFFLPLRFSFSLPLTSSQSFSVSIHDSSPALAFDEQVRQRYLYMDNKHHSLFVEILSDGTVSATQTQTPYTVLELKAVKPGYTAIWGVMSSLYMCMNAAGHLFTQGVFQEAECSFSEMLQPDGYTHFLSAHHRLHVSFIFESSPEKHTIVFSQFLPLRTQHFADRQDHAEKSSIRTDVDLDSDDPFRLINKNQHPKSPLFHIAQ